MVPEGHQSWWLSPVPTALSGDAGTEGISLGWRGADGFKWTEWFNQCLGVGVRDGHCVVRIVSLAFLVGGDHTHMGAQLQPQRLDDSSGDRRQACSSPPACALPIPRPAPRLVQSWR